eukprot:TRINITY_DN1060_c0_g1_i1.p1 TRINITY_DN1060_c0_g1~~TRINITY_DN1060_c0_g1_i1.p1  ORF type:complete len:1673 (+),score=441.91 TRINITY_DN1060_c0_g1_i1:456-5021(+)
MESSLMSHSVNTSEESQDPQGLVSLSNSIVDSIIDGVFSPNESKDVTRTSFLFLVHILESLKMTVSFVDQKVSTTIPIPKSSLFKSAVSKILFSLDRLTLFLLKGSPSEDIFQLILGSLHVLLHPLNDSIVFWRALMGHITAPLAHSDKLELSCIKLWKLISPSRQEILKQAFPIEKDNNCIFDSWQAVIQSIGEDDLPETIKEKVPPYVETIYSTFAKFSADCGLTESKQKISKRSLLLKQFYKLNEDNEKKIRDSETFTISAPNLISVSRDKENQRIMRSEFDRHESKKQGNEAWEEITQAIEKSKFSWCPELPGTSLEKWKRDCIEGRNDVRRRMERDWDFFIRYPSVAPVLRRRPRRSIQEKQEDSEFLNTQPISRDSFLFSEREKTHQRLIKPVLIEMEGKIPQKQHFATIAGFSRISELTAKISVKEPSVNVAVSPSEKSDGKLISNRTSFVSGIQTIFRPNTSIPKETNLTEHLKPSSLHDSQSINVSPTKHSQACGAETEETEVSSERGKLSSSQRSSFFLPPLPGLEMIGEIRSPPKSDSPPPNSSSPFLLTSPKAIPRHLRQQQFDEIDDTSVSKPPILSKTSPKMTSSPIVISPTISPVELDSTTLMENTLISLDENLLVSPAEAHLRRLMKSQSPFTHLFPCSIISGLDERLSLACFLPDKVSFVVGFSAKKTGPIKSGEKVAIEEIKKQFQQHKRVLSARTANLERIRAVGLKRSFTWERDSIFKVCRRRYLFQNIALEMWSPGGRSIFLVFDKSSIEVIWGILKSLAPPNCIFDSNEAGISSLASVAPAKKVQTVEPSDQKSSFNILSNAISANSSATAELEELTQEWAEGKITNFQYLMHINKRAGRSQNDLSQYPVFPWILSDYSSSKLDFSNPSIFRDLSKPMGALNETRLQKAVELFNVSYDPNGESTGISSMMSAFHWGSLYSSMGVVVYYLLRVEPYTQQALELQGGKWDHPDRVFHSVQEAWAINSGQSAQVMELIPEFFYFPQFLQNSNNFILGKKQNSEIIHDVLLPPWANSDPRKFVQLNLQALESEYVSLHLNEWIDLIFGYKQRGEDAISSANVFNKLSYEGGVNIDEITDPVEKRAAIDTIINFGQIPRQLWNKPHPQRQVFLKNGDTPLSLAFPSKGDDLSLVPKMKSFLLRNIGDFVEDIIFDPSSPEKIIVSGRSRKLIQNAPNSLLAWGFPDNSVRCWLGEKTPSCCESSHFGGISCVAVDEFGTLIATGGNDSTVRFIHKITRSSGGMKKAKKYFEEDKRPCVGHTAPVSVITLSASNALSVSGSVDGTCFMWDTESCTCVHQLPHGSSPIIALDIQQATGDIATLSSTSLRVWTINGEHLGSLSLLRQGETEANNNFISTLKEFTSCTFWDDGQTLLQARAVFTGHSNGSVVLWELIDNPATSLKSPSPLTILSDNTVERIQFRPLRHFSNSLSFPITCIRMSIEAKSDISRKAIEYKSVVIAGDECGNVVAWDQSSEQLESSTSISSSTSFSKQLVFLNKDGTIIKQ